LPYDDVDFSRVLDAFASRGLIVKYEAKPNSSKVLLEMFGYIPTWSKHQFVNNKERPSEIPPPPSNTDKGIDFQEVDATATRSSRDTDATVTRSSRVSEFGVKELELELERKGTGTYKGLSAKSAPFVLPEWIPEKPWNDYLEMRRRLKKPATKRAMELAVKELEKLADQGQSPKLILEQSIINSWQGIFPLRNGGSNGTGNQSAKPDPNTRFERNLKNLGVHPKVDGDPS
jgi:hypothetical protein